MSNNGNTKKRRVEGSARVSIDDGGDNSSAELSAIKSMMQDLVKQNHIQTTTILEQNAMMQIMRGEIKQLTEKCDAMETTIEKKDVIISRFDEIDDKLNYHEILLQNQQWKYSATYPCGDYWNSLDANEREIARVFLTEIKKCTQEMRYGTGDTIRLTIDADLPYSEVFLPHWKEFANALKQYRYYLDCAEENKSESKYDSSLCLWNMELSDEVLDLLAKALKSTFFNRLALVDNNFGEKGIDFALNYLEKNKKLIEFGLVDNPINNMSVQRLCEIVKTHPSIKYLALNRCFTSINGYEVLKLIMTDCITNKLRKLSLCHNDISTGGDTFIADFIMSNSRLSSLELDANKLDDNDATNIAAALKDNTKLRTLNIGDNSVTNAGWEALSKAVFDKTSLDSAADSNHTCCIDFPEDDNEFDGVRKINGTGSYSNVRQANYFNPINVRQKKIYHVISSRNRSLSNVDYFDDDMPVELLPDVLYSIQKYAGYHVPNFEGTQASPSQDPADVKPVSIMFEILQRWDKSLAVFEALSS